MIAAEVVMRVESEHIFLSRTMVIITIYNSTAGIIDAVHEIINIDWSMSTLDVI